MSTKQEEQKELPEGCYVLTEDVNNPGVDRRTARDWTRQAVWLKGTRIYARQLQWVDDEKPERSRQWIELEYVGAGRRGGIRISPGHVGYQVLASKLQPVEEDFTFFTHRVQLSDSMAFAVLEKLVQTGRTTPGMLEALMLVVEEEWDAEYKEAQRKRQEQANAKRQ